VKDNDHRILIEILERRVAAQISDANGLAVATRSYEKPMHSDPRMHETLALRIEA
jgi:hypothetical protein